MSNLRKKILESEDLPQELLAVPEWGVELLVRGMSAKARAVLMDKALNRQTREMDLTKLYPLLVIETVFDPEDESPVFTQQDIDALNSKSGATMEKVAQVSMRLSGLDGEEGEELGKLS